MSIDVLGLLNDWTLMCLCIIWFENTDNCMRSKLDHFYTGNFVMIMSFQLLTVYIFALSIDVLGLIYERLNVGVFIWFENAMRSKLDHFFHWNLVMMIWVISYSVFALFYQCLGTYLWTTECWRVCMIWFENTVRSKL